MKDVVMSSPSATDHAAAPRQSRRGEPAWEVALLFPQQGDWTDEEYLALNTNRLVELCNGCLDILPMPTVFHQLLVEYLHALLRSYVRKHADGLVLFAPLPVKLKKGKYREPDVIYARRARIDSVHGQPRGADLVMEVVSEGEQNRRRDLEVKRIEYAAAGIAEYWIIDPEQRSIEVLVLDGKSYQSHGRFGEREMAASKLLDGFVVDVAEMFAAADGGEQSAEG